MFPSTRLKYLQVRKKELLVASEVQRRRFANECATIQERLEWADPMISMARRAAPVIGPGVPFLCFWLDRHEERGHSWLRKLSVVLPFARRLTSAIKQFAPCQAK
jgi:hypothetical protein